MRHALSWPLLSMKSLINVTIYTKDAVSKPAPNSTQVDAVCALLCGMQTDMIYFISGVSSWPKWILSMDFAFASK